MDITTLIIAMGIPSVVTTFCFGLSQRKITKRQKAEEEKEKARRENEAMVAEGVNAAIVLCVATAKAVQRIPDTHCNGDMSEALDYAVDVKNKYRDFIRKQGIEALY